MPRQNRFARGLLTCSLLIGLLIGLILPSLSNVRAASQQQAATHIVISQVYGGGGNVGSPYQNDFVELFNPTGSSVPLDTWSIQYASGTGTGLFSGNVTFLSGSIASGGYYLVQLGSGTTTGLPLLPSPDVTGTTTMSAGAGKVILANTTTGLACNGGTNSSSPCSASDLASIIDSVGYGTATSVNYYEGSGPAPSPSNTTSDLRSLNGCVDTDDNSADFVTGAPNPRNTSSSTTDCGGLFTATAAFNQTGTAAVNQTGTSVAVLTGTAGANQTNTAIVNLTGTAAQNQTSTSAALTTSPTATKTLSTPSTPTPTATPCYITHHTLLINEVGWMGTKASSSDEWVELYNPSACSVDLTDWILRGINLYYTTGNFEVTLTGVIPAGGYFVLMATNSVFQNLPSGTVTQVNSSLNLPDHYQALQLVSSANTQVDTANYSGSYSWPAGSSTYRTSMERNHQLEDGSSGAWVTYGGSSTTKVRDHNGNYVLGTPGQQNWTYSVTLTPTPRAPTKVPTSRPTPVPRLVINEFLPRAGFDWNQDGTTNTFDEFIEIANDSGINVNLKGWRLQVASGDSSSYTLPSVVLKPGDHALFYGKQTNILLSDGGDTVQLFNPNDVLMDAETYSAVLKPDRSWCRLPDTRGSWYSDCFPTPNQINSRTGNIPAAVPGSGLQPPQCLLPDTLPSDFLQAECNGYGADMWQAGYWDQAAGQGDRIIPQNGSKWETFIE
ncbi:MAG TPA: lamin tail domain-containing protein [Anaerolineales bacterium]|nr:lamin tail domain-containing protein [Anaerolineales bacterium]